MLFDRAKHWRCRPGRGRGQRGEQPEVPPAGHRDSRLSAMPKWHLSAHLSARLVGAGRRTSGIRRSRVWPPFLGEGQRNPTLRWVSSRSARC